MRSSMNNMNGKNVTFFGIDDFGCNSSFPSRSSGIKFIKADMSNMNARERKMNFLEGDVGTLEPSREIKDPIPAVIGADNDVQNQAIMDADNDVPELEDDQTPESKTQKEQEDVHVQQQKQEANYVVQLRNRRPLLTSTLLTVFQEENNAVKENVVEMICSYDESSSYYKLFPNN